jgi:hypothetical protein
MAKSKERKQIYGGRRPKDYVQAHNHVMHTALFTHGTNGFRRFWIPPEWVKSGEWAECPCGWGGPKWKLHYAWKEHSRIWKRQIKEHGSLEGAYRDIERRLHKAGAWVPSREEAA